MSITATRPAGAPAEGIGIIVDRRRIEWFNPSGELTDDGDETFTNGHCWYLAWVLNQLTGWDIIVAGCQTDTGFSWCHVGVHTPCDGILDVRGRNHYSSWLDNWCSLGEALEDTEGTEYDGIVVPADQYAALLDVDVDEPSPAFRASTHQVAQLLLHQLAA